MYRRMMTCAIALMYRVMTVHYTYGGEYQRIKTRGKTMVDITEFQVDADAPHTHVAIIGDSLCMLNVDDDLEDCITSAVQDDCQLFEMLEDVCIPYITFDGEPHVGANYLQAIMKSLYKSYGAVAVLENPEPDKPIPVSNVHPNLVSMRLCSRRLIKHSKPCANIRRSSTRPIN
jgi:hypothetical protein